MVSSVMEGHIKKLRKAAYLSNDITYRLPEKGQLIPTPRPYERVVFLPHFLRGLGFPLVGVKTGGSRVGGPDRNSGGATHSASRGSVI